MPVWILTMNDINVSIAADLIRLQVILSAASRDDGYCEATIPVVKGHHVT